MATFSGLVTLHTHSHTLHFDDDDNNDYDDDDDDDDVHQRLNAW